MIAAVEKMPAEEKDDISKLVSGMVKHSIGRQMSYKTMGVNEVMMLYVNNRPATQTVIESQRVCCFAVLKVF